MSKLNIPFVQRDKHLCPRTDGYSTALSARYDGWGGYTTTTDNTQWCLWSMVKADLTFTPEVGHLYCPRGSPSSPSKVTLFDRKGHPLQKGIPPTLLIRRTTSIQYNHGTRN